MEISSNPKTWNQHRPEGGPTDERPQRQLLAMDPPEHAVYRNLTNRHFTPRAMQKLEAHIDEMAIEVIDEVVERLLDRVTGEGRCDFVFDLAMRLPVYAICELLGVPREDAEQMFHWSNEVAGPSDPEFQKGRTREETARHGTEQILGYFKALADERRNNPQNDLMTVLVQATIDGKPLPEIEVLACIVFADPCLTTWLRGLAERTHFNVLVADGMLQPFQEPS